MEALLIAARGVHFAATISLAGVLVLPCLIATPSAWLGEQLRRLAWASLALALVSGAAWLAAVASAMSGASQIEALANGAWVTVLTRTRFGNDWLLRLVLIALVALSLPLRRRWVGLVLTALLLVSLAWAGHGAATPGLPGDLHRAADVLHLLAAGLWLGTLVPFALLLAEAWRERQAEAARVAARRFSHLAIGSVAVLLATGLVNTWFLAGTVPALFGTGYGQLLLAKIALFLVLLAIGAVNLLRLAPRLASRGGALWRALLWLRRNALSEAAIGLVVLAIVGALGALPPGAHTEPHWPLPFRIEFAALSRRGEVMLASLVVIAGICAIAAAAAAAAARYRRSGAWVLVLAACLVIGWKLRPAVEPAYPTSFAVPAEPYAAPSIARGAALYSENCALCHGASGRGDGPAASAMRVRPADLTAHLFAHTPGDLFWQVSHGGGGAMPGFADAMTTRQRWDVVNFLHARAAGHFTLRIGPQVTDEAAPDLPDFTFPTEGHQQALHELLKNGPALLILYELPEPASRLATLGRLQPSLAFAAVSLHDVSSDVRSTLALFRAPDDGGESELLLDRNGRVRARWTAHNLADLATLLADGEHVARTEATVGRGRHAH